MRILIVCLMSLCSPIVTGQTVTSFPDSQWSNRLPGKTYYQGLEHYRNGNLTVATEAFESALATCSKHENGKWIDAIPVHAMLGDCYYHHGDLRRSILHVEAAIELYRRHIGWLDAIQWSVTERIELGQADNRSQSIVQTPLGVLALPEWFGMDATMVNLPRARVSAVLATLAGHAKVDAVEILRGVIAASYRRRIIVGSAPGGATSKGGLPKPESLSPNRHTKVSSEMLAAVAACIDFAGSANQTPDDLGAIAMIDDRIHPLSPLIYLSAARIAIEMDDDERAAKLAWHAAESAAALGQTEVFSEAAMLTVRCGDAESYNLHREKILSASVSFLQRGRLATIGALLAACDCYLIEGDAKAAETMVQQAIAMMQRGDINQPRWAAHADYLLARVYASDGKSLGESSPNEIDSAIARVIAFAAGDQHDNQTIASPKRFQLNRAIAYADRRSPTASHEMAGLNQCTADPPPWLWKADPVDAISFLAMDRRKAFFLQLRLASKQGDRSELVTLVDSMLRHRFLVQLPLGGRVQQVRNLVTANPDSLDPSAADQRKNASGRLKELIDSVSGFDAGLAPTRSDIATLESLATEISLSSQPIASSVPTPIQIEQAIGAMPVDLAMLIFIDLETEMLAMLVSPQGIKSWVISNSRTIQQEVVGLLRNLGVPKNRNGTRLRDTDQWKVSARKLRERILPEQHLQTMLKQSRVVIIPDGALWYVPFELMFADEPSRGEARLSISYSPTPGLAMSSRTISPRTYDYEIALIAGALLAPGNEKLDADLHVQLSDALRDQAKVPAQGDAIDYRLKETPRTVAIIDCVRPIPGRPLGLNLIGQGTPDPLSDWMQIPRRVPQRVILAGFQSGGTHTPIGDGSELFFTITALHSTGVGQVLTSRWCVGGESTAVLMSELLQELPHEEIRPSLARATRVLRRQRWAPMNEPLITGNDSLQDDIDGEHPLFWSSYLLSAPFSVEE